MGEEDPLGTVTDVVGAERVKASNLGASGLRGRSGGGGGWAGPGREQVHVEAPRR